MGNFQQLRMQSLLGGFDRLTPGAGGYSDEDYNPNPSSPYTPGPSPGLEQVGSQQDRDAILGPDGRPLESNIQAPTIDPIGAPDAAPRNTVNDMLDAINRGYTPATSSRDRYDQLLNEAPTRNRPGILRTLAAGGLSLKAADPIATTEKVMYAPYYRQQADWKEKAEPYYKAAELENRANINERTLVSNAVQAQTAADRLAENARQADQKADIARTMNRIRQAQASGLEIKLDGNRWVGFDKTTGKMHPLGNSTGMTMQEIIDAKGEWMDKAADTRAASQAANQQGEMVTYTDPTTGKQSPGQRVGNTIYPLEMAQPGQRPGQRQAPASGVGTTVPITPPGSAPGQPVASRTPGKQVTGSVYKVGTEQETKAQTPLEQRMETNNKIAGILSRHPDWNNFVNYNSDTKLYEGMGAPPQPPARGLFGLGSGSDEDWTRYKDDMEGYNYLRSLLHPGMAPYPTVGGSNAEQKAQRAQKAAVVTPPDTSSKVPTKGIGPSGSTSAAPTGSGSAGIGPTNTPNSAKSLPAATESTPSKSDGTWMPPTPDSKFAFLPDSWNQYLNRAYKGPTTPPNASSKQPTPKTVPQEAIPPKSTAPQATDNGPDPIPERAAAAIPRGSKVDVNGNTFRYTDPQGNVRYYNRETNGWVDYDPLAGPRRRR